MIASHERQLISSKWTVTYKFVLPAGWITLFGWGTLGLFTYAFHDSHGGLPPPQLKWVFLVVWLIGSIVWYRSCIPLKRVLISGGDLIISNYAREVRVPLARIRRISEGRFQNPRSKRLVFNKDIRFGASVLFMPTQRFLWPWQEHPIASELRRLSGTS
jgi:hypothetical protein